MLCERGFVQVLCHDVAGLVVCVDDVHADMVEVFVVTYEVSI